MTQIPRKTPQKLKSEFRKDVAKLGFLFTAQLADHSVTCPLAVPDASLSVRRLYPAICSNAESNVNASLENRRHSAFERIVLALLWCLWQAIRLPLLGLLVILEPVVRFVLSAFALLMTLTAFFFEFASTRPFPFLGILAVALGAFCLLAVYEGLIQLLRFGGQQD